MTLAAGAKKGTDEVDVSKFPLQLCSSIVAKAFFAFQDASWQVDRIWSPFVENSPHAVLDLKRFYFVFLPFSQYIPYLLYHFENTFLSGSFILTISGAVKP